jgi:hypothetical protein
MFNSLKKALNGSDAEKTIPLQNVAAKEMHDLENRFPKEFSALRDKLATQNDVRAMTPEQLLRTMQEGYTKETPASAR